jgi:hypothetical protein
MRRIGAERNGEAAGNLSLQTTQVGGVVAVLPANNRADEIAGSMFAKVLAHRGVTVRVLTANDLKDLAVGQIRIACISSVPPTGLRRARSVCKRLRSRFPQIKLIIGLWGAPGNSTQSHQGLSAFNPDCVATSFDEAIRAVGSMK